MNKIQEFREKFGTENYFSKDVPPAMEGWHSQKQIEAWLEKALNDEYQRGYDKGRRVKKQWTPEESETTLRMKHNGSTRGDL